VIAQNQYRVAERGREPGLRLRRNGGEVALAEWGKELLAACAPIAAALDRACATGEHRGALDAARARLDDPAHTPSAHVLAQMHEHHRDSYVDFALTRSLQHRRTLLSLPLPDDAAARLAGMAAESLARQRELEASDTVPFEEYRQRYLALDVMSGMAKAPSATR